MPVSSLKVKANSDDLHLVGVKVAEQGMNETKNVLEQNSTITEQKAGIEQTELTLREQFIKIRESSGMKRKEFAKYLNIPYRTMQDWELGKSSMPKYVLELIAFKVKQELIPKAREAPKKDSVIEKIHHRQKENNIAINKPKEKHSKEAKKQKLR